MSPKNRVEQAHIYLFYQQSLENLSINISVTFETRAEWHVEDLCNITLYYLVIIKQTQL